ncbi:Ig-like domain-containing protein [Enterobacter sp. CFBP8995]|nr:Ig-like domain-containing protein [Enterobacter sp. CFBP8995]
MTMRTPKPAFLSYPTPLAAPITESLDMMKLGKYSSGIPIQTDSGLIFTSKNGWVEVNDFAYFGYKSQKVMLVQEKSTLEFSLADKGMTSFSFDYFSLHSPKSKVNVYDYAGNLIATMPLSVTGSPSKKNFVINQFDYNAPSGVTIGRVEIIAGDEPGVGDSGFNIDNISWRAADLLPVTITLDRMSKDSGSSDSDFITNDGSAGRNVSGSLDRYLGKEEQLEWWDGSAWQPVKVSGKSWSLNDNTNHNADWQYQLRVVNSGVAGKETTFDITLDTTPPDVQVLFTSMTKDNGADALDWKTTDGSAGRIVSGRLDKALDAGDFIEYSLDGRTWQKLKVESDLSWSLNDPAAHTADWQYLIRVTDLAGNQTPATAQLVELYPEPATINRVIDNAGNLKGDVADGMMTDDRTPGVNGTAPPVSLVTLYNGSEILAKVYADKDGNWQWTSPTNLNIGQYDFIAVASLGDRSAEPSNTHSIVIVPEATIIQLIDDVGLETGPQPKGAIIDDSTPVLSGQALAGSVVYLYDKGTLIASVQAKNDGSWTWDSAVTYPSGVALGDHSITIIFEKDGYTSDVSSPWTFTYDLANPTAIAKIDSMTKDSGLSNADFITNDGSAGRTVKGTLTEPLKAGEKVQLWDGSKWIDATVSGSNWSAIDSNAHNSNWQYKTRVVNTSNASGPEDTQNVVLDTQASTVLVQFINMTKDDGDNSHDWITGDGNAGRTVNGKLNKTLEGSDYAEYSLDNGVTWKLMVIQSDLSWSFIDTRAHNEDWQYQVRILDVAGNISVVTEQTVQFVLPPLTPVITQVIDNVAGGIVGNVATGNLTNDSTPEVRGTGQPNGKIILVMTTDTNDWDSGAVRSIEVPVDKNGNWQITINSPTLSDGEWYFRPKSVDANDNEGPLAAEWSVIIDTVTPKPLIEMAQDYVAGGKQNGEDIGNRGATNDPNPILKGSAEAGSVLRVYDKNNREIGSTIVLSDGIWTFKLPTQVDGTHSFTVKATDVAGNTSQTSDPYIINVDIYVPPPSITAGTDNVGLTETILRDRVTDDTTPEFYGREEPNTLIWLYDNNILLGTFKADNSGNWKWTLPELEKGLHKLVAYSESEAGTMSAASAPYDFQVGFVWDFNSGMGGWSIVGDHAKNGATYLQRSAGKGNQLMFETPTEGNYSGDIMRNQIDVVAGQTYDFSFILTRVSYWTLTNPAKLAFKVNGVLVSSYYTVQDTPQKVEGSWTATTTGKVTLSIDNLTASGSGNDFWIDDIAIVPHKNAGAVNGIKQMMMDVDNAREALTDDAASTRSLSTEVCWEEVKSGALQTGIIDTINVEGENQQLALGELRPHVKAVNTIDITGHGNNTLSISLEDILALGGEELFVSDKTLQLQIRGDEGDVINLNSIFKGEDFGHWTQQDGSVSIGGISYNIYKHDSLDVELVIEDGIKSNLI